MKFIRSCWLAALLGSPLASAQQAAAPLGLELGKTTCKEAAVKLKLPAAGVPFISDWAGGPVRHLPAGASGVPGLTRGSVICDAQDRVVLVELEFDKGNRNHEAARTADQLDAKYQARDRKLPPVGDGYASWSASNSLVELDSPHLSFKFYVFYWAQGARETYGRFREQKLKQRDQQKAGNL